MTDQLFSIFNFEVVLEAQDAAPHRAAFSEVAGLEINLESVEVREGGYNVGVRRLVGKASHPELVLKRGVTLDADFWSWIDACMAGGAKRRDGAPIPTLDGEIIVHRQSQDSGDELKFRFYNGMPTKVRMSDLKATGGTEVAIEELHIAHEGLERYREPKASTNT